MPEIVFGDSPDAAFDVVDPQPKPPKFGAPASNETPDTTCEVCGRGFKSPGGMKRHRAQVHGIGADEKKSASLSVPRETLKSQADAFAMFFYGLLGGLLSQVDPVCGAALVSCQGDAAAAWYQAALVNPTVAKIIRSTESVGVWGMLFGAHLPLLEAVRQHHLSGRPAPEEVEVPPDATFAETAAS